ncbi:MAG: hypothetical protein RL001_462 [Pseudomonadota bacterium]|jgi:hypothetical protein
MARPAGIEPTTPWFVAKYSIQLSYGRVDQNYNIRKTVWVRPPSDSVTSVSAGRDHVLLHESAAAAHGAPRGTGAADDDRHRADGLPRIDAPRPADRARAPALVSAHCPARAVRPRIIPAGQAEPLEMKERGGASSGVGSQLSEARRSRLCKAL